MGHQAITKVDQRTADDSHSLAGTKSNRMLGRLIIKAPRIGFDVGPIQTNGSGIERVAERVAMGVTTWVRAESRFPPAAFLDVARVAFERQSIGRRSFRLDRRWPVPVSRSIPSPPQPIDQGRLVAGQHPRSARFPRTTTVQTDRSAPTRTLPGIGLDPCSKTTAASQLERQLVGFAVERPQAASAERPKAKSVKRAGNVELARRFNPAGDRQSGSIKGVVRLPRAPPRCHRCRHRAKAND